MNYIKTFESMLKPYKIGDYIIINVNSIDVKNILLGNVDEYANVAKIILLEDSRSYPFRIKFYNDYDFNVNESEILRLATEDENNEYHAKKEMNKYNL